jgi:hypothetical protein
VRSSGSRVAVPGGAGLRRRWGKEEIGWAPVARGGREEVSREQRASGGKGKDKEKRNLEVEDDEERIRQGRGRSRHARGRVSHGGAGGRKRTIPRRKASVFLFVVGVHSRPCGLDSNSVAL